MRHLQRWKAFIVIIAVLVIVGMIHYTSAPRARLTIVEEVLRDLVAPVQRLTIRATYAVTNVVDSFKELSSIRERNAHLETLVTDLQSQVYQLAEYERENKWLREALDFKNEVDHNMLAAEVIGRIPSNWLHTVTINKGRTHGVEQGMAVISSTGIVGTIHEVSRTSSTVLLSIDSQSAVGGAVQPSGDLVLVEGGPANSGLYIATPLDRDTSVAPGDVILTSGLSWLFPSKIPIGEVVEVESSNYDLSFIATVEPFVDFARLDYVFVVIPESVSE